MLVWVKFGNNSIKVDTSRCTDVDDIIREVKKELANKLKDVDADNISLWTSTLRDDGTLVAKEELRPGLSCADLFVREDFKENTDQHPLLIRTTDIVLPTSRFKSKSSLSKKEPHPSRKRRWDELNAVLAKFR